MMNAIGNMLWSAPNTYAVGEHPINFARRANPLYCSYIPQLQVLVTLEPQTPRF